MKTLTKVFVGAGTALGAALLIKKLTAAQTTHDLLNTYKSKLQSINTLSELGTVYNNIVADKNSGKLTYDEYSILYSMYRARYDQLTKSVPAPVTPPATVVTPDKFNVVKAYIEGADVNTILLPAHDYLLVLQVNNALTTPVVAQVAVYLSQPNPNDNSVLNAIAVNMPQEFASGTFSYKYTLSNLPIGTGHVWLRIDANNSKYLKTVDTGIAVVVQNPAVPSESINSTLSSQLNPITPYVLRVWVVRGALPNQQQYLLWDKVQPVANNTLTGGFITGDEVSILFSAVPDDSAIKQSQVGNRAYTLNNYWINFTW